MRDERDHSGLVFVGYVTAVILPIVGFIIGCIVACRPTVAAKHGGRIIALSVVVFIIGFALIEHHISQQQSQSSALTDPSDPCVYC